MTIVSPTGLWSPATGDANNPPADMLTLVGQLDLVTIPLFASTGTRDTAYASRAFGMCFVGASADAGVLYVRRGGGFHALIDADKTLPTVAAPANSGFISTVQAARTSGLIVLSGSIYYSGGFGTSFGGGAQAQLPVGYRPASDSWCVAVGGASGAAGLPDWTNPASVRVGADGTIFGSKAPAVTTTILYISLDGIALRGA